MAAKRGTAFAFDVGTNSIGWCAVEIDETGEPCRIIDAGVRIYADGREPKSGTSLTEGRRLARGMSRRRDRYKRRRKAVLRTLTEYGLMPPDDAARRALVAETNDKAPGGVAADVYALRARALDEKLPLPHIGRALFHLNQRRGFKSNRKTDRRDNEQGKIAAGISRLGTAIDAAGARTLGEFLHMRRQAGEWVRVRPSRVNGKDDKPEEGYGFYPERSFLRDEFDLIWSAQAAHYPDVLTDERRDHLAAVIFHQRPLKKPRVGKCGFNPAEERVAKAHPLFQEFRLLKELNELEIVHRDERREKLTPEQRDMLFGVLRSQRSSQMSAIRKTLKAPPGTRLNKEREARDKLLGDEVAAEMSAKERFGQAWFEMPLAERWAVISLLIEEDDPLAVTRWLEEKYGFAAERIDTIAAARLPAGYGRLGPSALAALVDELRTGTTEEGTGRVVVLTERQALECIWGDNPAVTSAVRNLDLLPEYQEILARRIPPGSEDPADPYDVRKGRITNPTVHIGLNQLRKVLNGLVRRFGKPQQIALELARELKLNEEQKREREREISRNTRAAEARSKKLVELGQPDNGYNRLLLKLWEQLDTTQPLNRCCVYCGKPIKLESLFSNAIDVDHILPWSQTLDDSQANRIVCHVECNRQKANHAPADVPQWQGRYDEILERANRLPLNKRWRFARDAMKKFKDDESFLVRQLTDTQYLSRLAHEYVGALFPDEEPDEWGVFARRNHVRVIPGRMTEMLRRQWGLNSILADHNFKNRNDHRHHAIDAAVVAVTTRRLLQRIATIAGGREALALEETIGKIDPPWPEFRDELKAVIDRIVVSHKPDHGTPPRPGRMGQTAGQLHNDTAFGFAYEMKDGVRAPILHNGVPLVVRRKLFMALRQKDLADIRDDRLRAYLEERLHGLSESQTVAELTRISQEGPYKGIRHVRVTEVTSVIPIRDKAGKAYKGYASGGNYRFDVWEMPDGRWDAEVVSVFQAHDPAYRSNMTQLHHNPRKIMSLMIGDMIAYEDRSNARVIARVRKFDQRNKQIYLDAHNEAGALDKRHKDPDDSFQNFSKTPNALRTIGARQIRIDVIGQVFDPGRQDRASRASRKQKLRD